MAGGKILIAAVVVVAVIVIVAVAVLALQSHVITGVVPSGVAITITNMQSQAVSAGFQQMIAVNASQYQAQESSNLGNIRFYQGSQELYSWCESGCSNSSTHAIFWVKLSSGISADNTSQLIMSFLSLSTNYDGHYTGEAPQLSSVYGEYDNGQNVFNHYANFAGTSMPAGWTAQPDGGAITVNNGISLYGGYASLTSDWPVSSEVADIYLTSENTNNGNDWILDSGNSATNYAYTPCAVGYQNQIAGGGTQGGAGLNVQNNGGGTPSVLAVADPNPTFPAVIGVYGSKLYANYIVAATITSGCAIQNQIFGSTYLQMTAGTGVGTANFAFDWVRMRTPPPGGVMPNTSFSAVT